MAGRLVDGGPPKVNKAMMYPVCGSDQVIPIFYGYPIGNIIDASDRGEAALGGCVVTGMMRSRSARTAVSVGKGNSGQLRGSRFLLHRQCAFRGTGA
jgi:hypothetical protein